MKEGFARSGSNRERDRMIITLPLECASRSGDMCQNKKEFSHCSFLCAISMEGKATRRRLSLQHSPFHLMDVVDIAVIV